MIESRTLQFIIKNKFGIAELPYSCTLAEAGFKHDDLLKIQQLIGQKFSKNVNDVQLNDTLYTLTDKINLVK
jgi:hypothetical protein